MKRVLRTIKKHWISVWLIIAALTYGTFVAIAAYTEVSSVKRVVTTQSKPQTPFSSNCMRKGGSRKQMNTSAYTVTVCNYDQNFPGVFNQSQIVYTLTATLQLKIGDNNYSYEELFTEFADADLEAYKQKFVDNADDYGIHKISDDNTGEIGGTSTAFSTNANYKISFPDESLRQIISSTDKFEVTIPDIPVGVENFTPEFFVKVEAVASSPDGLGDMSTILYRASNETVTTTWTGALAETDTKTVDYDFYNYILTGNGIGTVDIMWDPARLEINEFFTNELSGNVFKEENTIPTEITVDGATWNKLTLVVDPTDTLDESGNVTKKGKTRYEIQFYKVMEETSYTGDENAAEKYIKMSYTPQSE